MNRSDYSDDSAHSKDSARRSSAESVVMAQHVADVATARLPMTAGLRAAAEDGLPKRLARSLIALAEQLERGVPFSDALQQLQIHAPRRARALLLAMRSSADFAAMLTATLALERETAARRRELVGALAYPLVLLSATWLVFMGIYFWILPLWVTTFGDVSALDWSFGWASRSEPRELIKLGELFALHMVARWVLLAGGIALVVIPLVLRLVLGAGRFGRLRHWAPLLGPLWLHGEVAGWAALLATLLRSNIPLPEALRLTASAGSRTLEHATLRAAAMVDEGKRFPLALAAAGTFPASLAVFATAAAAGAGLADCMQNASELFQRRYRHRAALVRTLATPIAFMIVIMGMATMISLVLRPMVEMIRWLS